MSTGAVEVDNMIDKNQIVEAVKKVKEQSPSRNFKESVDIAINLKDINLQDPSKRFQLEVKLPHKLNKEVNICVFAEGSQLIDAQSSAAKKVIDKNELENISRDAKLVKKLAKQYDFFIASAPLMPIIGQKLGKFLGPRGKMPKPVPPTAPITPIIDNYSQMVQIRLRQSPVIHARIGTIDMEPEHLAENALSVIRAVEGKLEKGENNIKSIYLKSTMGPAIRVK